MGARPHSVPAILLLLGALVGCGTDTGAESASESSGSSSAPESPSGPTTVCTYTDNGQQPAKDVDPPSSEAPASGEVEVTLATNQGDIGATLDAKGAPCTVHSFVSLADQGYFDGSPCHQLSTQRIFVLQCGDPSGTGTQGPGYSFDDELTGNESYPAGTVAMANAGPDTNRSQFFLVYEETRLPPSYTVFGTMDDAGVEVVRSIAANGVRGGGSVGPPASEVVIETATVE
jgi:peptidyl-prolyl cis-trans isomerase B (cyclophilin B)